MSDADVGVEAARRVDLESDTVLDHGVNSGHFIEVRLFKDSGCHFHVHRFIPVDVFSSIVLMPLSSPELQETFVEGPSGPSLQQELRIAASTSPLTVLERWTAVRLWSLVTGIISLVGCIEDVECLMVLSLMHGLGDSCVSSLQLQPNRELSGDRHLVEVMDVAVSNDG